MTRNRIHTLIVDVTPGAPSSDDTSLLEQLLQQAGATIGAADAAAPPARAAEEAADDPERTIRSERLVFEAAKEVVIRCGSASITLTESGKVLIKGEYVSSRSTGTNRIRGGSVQIN